MSNAPWTPGPWHAACDQAGRIFVTSGAAPATSHDYPDHERRDRKPVVRVYDTGDGAEYTATEADANARLIAEAPAMAEALADMVEALSFVERHYNTCINPPTLDQARAILARIKGATP